MYDNIGYHSICFDVISRTLKKIQSGRKSHSHTHESETDTQTHLTHTRVRERTHKCSHTDTHTNVRKKITHVHTRTKKLAHARHARAGQKKNRTYCSRHSHTQT